MTRTIGLRLDPLDTLFFRDGRPFGAATRGEGGLPQPRTLAGALRTRLVSQFVDLGQLPGRRRQGAQVEEALRQLGCPGWVLGSRFRGPWLACCRGRSVEPLVPAPAILGREGNSLFRLSPLPPRGLPGWHDPDGLWPLWRAGGAEAKPVGGYINQEGLKLFLGGDDPGPEHLVPAEALYGHDERTGLAIAPDALTGIDGMLYGIKLLVLRPGACLYAEVIPGGGAPADVAGCSVETLRWSGV